jgi:hypothetical protein
VPVELHFGGAMLLRFRPIATWLVLGGYLLAITASDAFHQHEHHHDADDAAGHVHARSDGLPIARGLHEESDEGNCAVCQFLAQKSAPVQPSADTSWIGLWTPLPEAGAVRILSRAPQSGRNRDPPCVV